MSGYSGNSISMGSGNVVKNNVKQEIDGGKGRNVLSQVTDNVIGKAVTQSLKNTSEQSENKLHVTGNLKVGGKYTQKVENLDASSSSKNSMKVLQSAEFGEVEQSQQGKGKMVNDYVVTGKTTVEKSFAQTTKNSDNDSSNTHTNQVSFGDETDLGSFSQTASGGGKGFNEIEAKNDVKVRGDYEQIVTNK